MNQDDLAQQDEQQRLAQIMSQISPPNPNGPPGIALPGLPSPYPLQQEPPAQIQASPDAAKQRQQPSTLQRVLGTAVGSPQQRQSVQNSPLGEIAGAVARKMGQTPNQDISGPQTQPQQQRPGSLKGALGQVLQVPQQSGQGVIKPGGLRSLLDELLRIK